MGQARMGSVGKMDSKLEVLYIVDRGRNELRKGTHLGKKAFRATKVPGSIPIVLKPIATMCSPRKSHRVPCALCTTV